MLWVKDCCIKGSIIWFPLWASLG